MWLIDLAVVIMKFTYQSSLKSHGIMGVSWQWKQSSRIHRLELILKKLAAA